MSKRRLLNERTWVTTRKGCDERGLHAEINVDIECLPLVGVIYEHLKHLALEEDENIQIRGLSDEWYDNRCKTRVIKVYPKNGVIFRNWYHAVTQAIVEAITDEIRSKINIYH